ncbi:MAG: hypothetical protein ACK6BM_12900 [Cyanobacteriota bacterium]|jgi:hypothetical protein
MGSEDQAKTVDRAESSSPARTSADEATAAVPRSISRWVKTECGRAKYQELASRGGPRARLRLWWFVLIAALRDWRLPPSP